MKYIVVLDIEVKEDDSGVFPIGWRVSRVEGLRQSLPGYIW